MRDRWFGIRRWPPGRVGAAVAVATVFGLTGCGDGDALVRVPVSGSVFTSGKPLASGTIRFVPTDGTHGPVASTGIADGFYTFTQEDGPVVGKHRVEVVTMDHLGFDPGDQEAAERAMAATNGRLPRSPVALTYSGTASPLRADVPPEGLPACDFVLDSKGRAVPSE